MSKEEQAKQIILASLKRLGVAQASNGEQLTSEKVCWWSVEALANELAHDIANNPHPDETGTASGAQNHQEHRCCHCSAIASLQFLIETADNTVGSGVWKALFSHMHSQLSQAQMRVQQNG